MDRKVIVYGLTCGSTDTSLVLVYGQDLRVYGHMPRGVFADNLKCDCLRNGHVCFKTCLRKLLHYKEFQRKL